jgi:hypothetical protein
MDSPAIEPRMCAALVYRLELLWCRKNPFVIHPAPTEYKSMHRHCTMPTFLVISCLKVCNRFYLDAADLSLSLTASIHLGETYSDLLIVGWCGNTNILSC